MTYPRMRLFNNMMLILTEGCNLRCAHCYEANAGYRQQRRMSQETARKAADLFFAQVPPRMARTSITFFGGEPTLEFDLIRYVVEYTYGHRTISGYSGHRYNYVINTNGTVLTDEMFEFYRKLGHKLNIRVSVDGYGENHDVVRKTATGQGSWRFLEKTLPRFRDLKEQHDVRVNLITTISKLTYKNIYSDYTRLFELAGVPIGFLFVHEADWNDDDFAVIKEQVSSLQEWCLDRQLTCSLCNISGASTRRRAPNSVDGSICGAGAYSFSVNWTGDIHPCHRCYYYGAGATYRLGDVDSGISPEKRARVWTLNRLDKLPAACQVCDPVLRHRCHLCFATNERVYGNRYEVSPGYCALMRDVYQLLRDQESAWRHRHPISPAGNNGPLQLARSPCEVALRARIV